MGIVSDSHGPAEAGIKVPASSSTVANSGSAVAAAAAAAAAAARVAASSEATGAADGFVGGPDNTITNADVDSGPQNDTVRCVNVMFSQVKEALSLDQPHQ